MKQGFAARQQKLTLEFIGFLPANLALDAVTSPFQALLFYGFAQNPIN